MQLTVSQREKLAKKARDSGFGAWIRKNEPPKNVLEKNKKGVLC